MLEIIITVLESLIYKYLLNMKYKQTIWLFYVDMSM